MKNFALIVDKTKGNSYRVIDGKAYNFFDVNKPYQFHGSIKNECFMGFWGYPFLFENGYFLNWAEHEVLPDLDLDLIMVAIESNYEKYTISQLRKKYPNAVIIGTIKETWNWSQHWPKRLEVYNQCDYVFSCIDERYFNNSIPQILQCTVPVKYIPQPINIEYLYDNFYKETRSEQIFSYWPYWNQPRCGQTEQFTNYISQKYNIPFIRPKGHDGVTKWLDYLTSWSQCTFHFNLDPIEYFPGQQAMQCAALGMIHLGGVNDAHQVLYPETATIHIPTLEEKFVELLNNNDKRIEHITYAWNKANELYSYNVVKKQIEQVYEEIKK